MSLSEHDARARFADSRVARLATVTQSGAAHIVPITFAVVGESTIVTAVDDKPKRTRSLKRLDNIAHDPAVAVLVDHYSDDWAELWWVRADGRARILGPEGDEELRQLAIASLTDRYPPYRDRPPAGDLIVIEVERWSGWSYF